MAKIPFKDTITIRVPGRGRGENEDSGGNLISSEKDKFGAIFTRPDAEFLPRRITKEILINVYDLGQVKNESGIYQDINFRTNNGYIYDDYYPDVVRSFQDLILFNFQELQNLIFTIPVEQWTEKYRKFDYESAEKYGVDFIKDNISYPLARNNSRHLISYERIYDENGNLLEREFVSNTKWTESGLKLEGINNFSIKTGPAFNNFDTGNTETYKITDVLDFNAGAVIINFSSEIEVFLVPALARLTGASRQSLNANEFREDELFLGFSPLPRNLFLSDIFGSQMLLVEYTTFIYDTDTEAEIIKIFYLASETLSQGILQLVYGNYTPGTPFRPPEQQSVSNFASGANFYGLNLQYQLPVIGALISIIKIGEKIYYVWVKDNPEYFNNSQCVLSFQKG